MLPGAIHQLNRHLPNWDGFPQRTSAVLICFLADHRLLLMRRSRQVTTHKRQICLPGGHRDPADTDPAATAIRETAEETAMDPQTIELWGHLPPCFNLAGNPVIPIVGQTSAALDDLKHCETETELLFSHPWQRFCRSEAESFHFNLFGCWRQSWLYQHDEGNIWGLTAKILYDCNFPS